MDVNGVLHRYCIVPYAELHTSLYLPIQKQNTFKISLMDTGNPILIKLNLYCENKMLLIIAPLIGLQREAYTSKVDVYLNIY